MGWLATGARGQALKPQKIRKLQCAEHGIIARAHYPSSDATGNSNFMELGKTEDASDGDIRTITVSMLREILASLQEAVVTVDVEQRRALLKDAIGKLREVLAPGADA